MSYTPRVAATKYAMKGLLATALASSSASGGQIPVEYTWNPNAEDESVFMTRPLFREGDRAVTPINLRVPFMQPGAQPLEERFTIDLTIWSFRGDLSAEGGYETELRLDLITGVIVATLANNPTVGVEGVLFQLPDAGGEQELAPYEKGWVALRVLPIEVTARLTA